MSREQLESARTLIRAKDYQAARKLLGTIDHPVAKEWLNKLDQIDPQPAPQKRSRLPLILLALLLVIIVVLLAIIVYQQSQISAQLARNDPNYKYTEIVLTYGDYRQTSTAFYQKYEPLINSQRTKIALTPTSTAIEIFFPSTSTLTKTPGGPTLTPFPTRTTNATYVEDVRQQAIREIAATFTAAAKSNTP